jgi:hypothetical protein
LSPHANAAELKQQRGRLIEEHVRAELREGHDRKPAQTSTQKLHSSELHKSARNANANADADADATVAVAVTTGGGVSSGKVHLGKAEGRRVVYLPLERVAKWYSKGTEFMAARGIRIHGSAPSVFSGAEQPDFHSTFVIGEKLMYTEGGFVVEMNKQLQHVFSLFRFLITAVTDSDAQRRFLTEIQHMFSTYHVSFMVGCVVAKEEGLDRDKPKGDLDVYIPGSVEARDARARGVTIPFKVDYGAVAVEGGEYTYKAAPASLVATCWREVYAAKAGVSIEEVAEPAADSIRKLARKAHAHTATCVAKCKRPTNSASSFITWGGKEHLRILRLQTCAKPAAAYPVSILRTVDAVIGFFTPHRWLQSGVLLNSLHEAVQVNPCKAAVGKLAVLKHALKTPTLSDSVMEKYVYTAPDGTLAYTAAGKERLKQTFRK